MVRATSYGPFTMFSKAVPEHFGLSFSTSGEGTTSNCDSRCRLLELCYAVRLERIYKSLNEKLSRHHRTGAIDLVAQAIEALKDKPLRWARLSVDGSLPKREQFSREQWSIFCRLLRELVQRALDLGAKWHIPVESKSKARSYRAALKGLPVVVRRSDQSRTVAGLLKSDDARSWVAVADELHSGCVTQSEKDRNTAYARQCALQCRTAGQTAVVCPAVAGSSHCGDCTACASDLVDIIFYPFHG